VGAVISDPRQHGVLVGEEFGRDQPMRVLDGKGRDFRQWH